MLYKKKLIVDSVRFLRKYKSDKYPCLICRFGPWKSHTVSCSAKGHVLYVCRNFKNLYYAP